MAVLLGLAGIPSSAPSAGARPSLRSALRSSLRPGVLRAGVVTAVGWSCLAGLNVLVALRLEEEFALGAGALGLWCSPGSAWPGC